MSGWQARHGLLELASSEPLGWSVHWWKPPGLPLDARGASPREGGVPCAIVFLHLWPLSPCLAVTMPLPWGSSLREGFAGPDTVDSRKQWVQSGVGKIICCRFPRKLKTSTETLARLCKAKGTGEGAGVNTKEKLLRRTQGGEERTDM